jgi:hypothetical protein
MRVCLPYDVQGNDALTSFAGLEGLTTINGYLYIDVRPQADMLCESLAQNHDAIATCV